MQKCRARVSRWAVLGEGEGRRPPGRLASCWLPGGVLPGVRGLVVGGFAVCSTLCGRTGRCCWAGTWTSVTVHTVSSIPQKTQTSEYGDGEASQRHRQDTAQHTRRTPRARRRRQKSMDRDLAKGKDVVVVGEERVVVLGVRQKLRAVTDSIPRRFPDELRRRLARARKEKLGQCLRPDDKVALVEAGPRAVCVAFRRACRRSPTTEEASEPTLPVASLQPSREWTDQRTIYPLPFSTFSRHLSVRLESFDTPCCCIRRLVAVAEPTDLQPCRY